MVEALWKEGRAIPETGMGGTEMQEIGTTAHCRTERSLLQVSKFDANLLK